MRTRFITLAAACATLAGCGSGGNGSLPQLTAATPATRSACESLQSGFAFADTTTTATTAAATKLSDFTDADKLTYTEAADYLIAAGVVKGDTATTLNPQGDFTREQAAKLISYACLGQVAADNLKASVAPFTDVAADRWSAGYIAYCQKQGFVNGYGDGNFGPNDKVTGYQFGKMLLVALGYEPSIENFVGGNWAVNVAKRGFENDLFLNLLEWKCHFHHLVVVQLGVRHVYLGEVSR